MKREDQSPKITIILVKAQELTKCGDQRPQNKITLDRSPSKITVEGARPLSQHKLGSNPSTLHKLVVRPQEKLNTY